MAEFSRFPGGLPDGLRQMRRCWCSREGILQVTIYPILDGVLHLCGHLGVCHLVALTRALRFRLCQFPRRSPHDEVIRRGPWAPWEHPRVFAGWELSDERGSAEPRLPSNWGGPIWYASGAPLAVGLPIRTRQPVTFAFEVVDLGNTSRHPHVPRSLWDRPAHLVSVTPDGKSLYAFCSNKPISSAIFDVSAAAPRVVRRFGDHWDPNYDLFSADSAWLLMSNYDRSSAAGRKRGSRLHAIRVSGNGGGLELGEITQAVWRPASKI
jgi:hypothetical protein